MKSALILWTGGAGMVVMSFITGPSEGCIFLAVGVGLMIQGVAVSISDKGE